MIRVRALAWALGPVVFTCLAWGGHAGAQVVPPPDSLAGDTILLRGQEVVVPIMGADQLRVDRGVSSVLHGPNVLGGVVEVDVARTADPLEEPEPAQLAAGIDHLGGLTASSVAAHRFYGGAGDLLVRVGGGHRSSDGDVRPGPLSGSTVGADRLRTNSHHEQSEAFVALRYRSPEERWLSLTMSGFRAERGVPPEEHEARPRLWRYPDVKQFFAAASGGTGDRATRWGRGDVEASVGFALGRNEIEAYETLAYETVQGGESGRDRTLTVRLLADHTVGRSGELRAAATLSDVLHDEVLRPDLTSSLEARDQQRLWSLGSEFVWRVEEGPVAAGFMGGARVSFGLALDGASTPETGGQPERGAMTRLGGRMGLSGLAGEWGRVHVGLSRRGRFPSLRELYSSALGRFEPNPDLDPELLTTGELGITSPVASGEIQAAIFHQRLTDAIVRTAGAVANYRRVNRDEVRSTGLEVLASTDWRDVTMSGDLTLQRVRVMDPDVPAGARWAEYHPAIAGAVRVDVPLPVQLRGGVTVEYTGRQWCVHPDEAGPGLRLDPSTRVGMELRRVVDWTPRASFSRLDASLSLDNVTDAANYDQCGLPRPGRTLRLELRVRSSGPPPVPRPGGAVHGSEGPRDRGQAPPSEAGSMGSTGSIAGGRSSG